MIPTGASIPITIAAKNEARCLGACLDAVLAAMRHAAEEGLGFDLLVVIFLGMFAVITPALVAGAFAERATSWPSCQTWKKSDTSRSAWARCSM